MFKFKNKTNNNYNKLHKLNLNNNKFKYRVWKHPMSSKLQTKWNLQHNPKLNLSKKVLLNKFNNKGKCKALLKLKFKFNKNPQQLKYNNNKLMVFNSNYNHPCKKLHHNNHKCNKFLLNNNKKLTH